MIIATDMEHAEEANEQLPQLLPYHDVVAMGADQADYYLSDLPGVLPDENNTVAVLYTSGTTGRPKGVMLSHHNLIANAISGYGVAPEEEQEEQKERQLAILPLAHAFGILVSNVAYLSGATIVMHTRFDPQAVIASIERHRITSFAGVPAMFIALLNTPDVEKHDLSSLQYCVSGSAPLPVSVLERFQERFHCQIREGYGLSESSAALTGHGANIPIKPGTVGKALPGVELLIVDETGQPLPAGNIGEVIARGPNIMQGYYAMPDETRATLRAGWLYSGDMGHLDEDGYLTIVERKKDLIIRGGFNVYPRDVEEVLSKHPAVIEAAVIGIPSERMGEDVKAIVVTREPIAAGTLIAFCQQYLANYKTPSQIEFINALPRNTVGKIDKKVLRASSIGL
jgi:long-chain acyl-CoA synthetase